MSSEKVAPAAEIDRAKVRWALLHFAEAAQCAEHPSESDAQSSQALRDLVALAERHQAHIDARQKRHAHQTVQHLVENAYRRWRDRPNRSGAELDEELRQEFRPLGFEPTDDELEELDVTGDDPDRGKGPRDMAARAVERLFGWSARTFYHQAARPHLTQPLVFGNYPPNLLLLRQYLSFLVEEQLHGKLDNNASSESSRVVDRESGSSRVRHAVALPPARPPTASPWATDLAQVRSWCDAHEQHLRCEENTSMGTVTIVKVRPSSGLGSPPSDVAAAQLRFDSSSELWRLYLVDAALAFCVHNQAPPTKAVKELLDYLTGHQSLWEHSVE